jgi:hypothetical protein
MPIYNRLDVSFTKTYKTSKGKDAKLIFTLYNTYGYANAFAIDYYPGGRYDALNNNKQTDFFGRFTAKSLFRFVPGLNWSIKL